MGASLTCGSDTIPVLLRPCSLMALRAALYLQPPKHHVLPRNILHWWMGSGARAPRDQGCGPVLSAVCRALRCSTRESLHGFADGSLAVKAQARFPRCSSVCGCITAAPILFH